jgi:hypothetical protein
MQPTDAIAFEAAAALDAYEEQLLTVRRIGAHPHQLASTQMELRRVCNCCLRLPQLSGPGLALLLAHHRLLAEWASGHKEGVVDAASPSLATVEQCLASLQRRCRELFLAPHLQ